MSSVGLVVAGVSHAYQSLAVLDGLDLDIPAGEVTVLVGAVRLRQIHIARHSWGLVKPSSGVVRMRGAVDTACLNPLTYVFQDFSLVPWRTVTGNVSLVLEDSRLSRGERAARVSEVLALTGLSAFAHAWPKQLSGGMRQRVGIARAMAVRPAVLLMDEPLSALDAQTRALLLDEFVALIGRSGATTVYVTHNLAEATRLGQQIVVMGRRPGRIVETIRIDTPLDQRRAEDPVLLGVEARLWALLRDGAAAADRELSGAA